MTDKITEAAREAGFVVQRDEWVLQTMLRTFYAIARAEALEDAAQAVKSLTAEIRFQAIEHYKFADAAEKNIHALKEQQHG